MAESVRDEIFGVINDFLASLSNQKPPLSNTLTYLWPESFAVVSSPGEIFQGTLADYVVHLEKQLSTVYEAGATSASTVLLEPNQDVWISERLAAVFSGYSFTVDNQEKNRGVAVYTLVRREDRWKIGAIGAMQWDAGEAPPPVVSQATSELLEPVLESNRLLNEKKWDGIDQPLLPGGGVTVSRFPQPLVTMLWPELNEKMRSMSERAPGYVEHKLMDWEGRSMGNFGLVWTPYTVSLDGKLRISGYHNVHTLLKRDGKWLISGTQDG